MVQTRTMAPFSSCTTLEHVVNNILEATTTDAAYRRAIHAAGAEDITDFMMISPSDFQMIDWPITTGSGQTAVTTTTKLKVVQQRKLIALQTWGRFNGIMRTNEEWEALTAAEFKTHVCLLYTSPSPRDLSTSRMPSSA